MAQPFRARDQEGISTWSMADLRRHQEKMDEERIQELQQAQRESEAASHQLKAAQVAVAARDDQDESDYEMDDFDDAELMALDNGN
jgi:DNA excision repair protein ERCC-2